MVKPLRYVVNLIWHFKWTGCEHKRRRLVKHYFSQCVDCGTLFDDGLQTETDYDADVIQKTATGKSNHQKDSNEYSA